MSATAQPTLVAGSQLSEQSLASGIVPLLPSFSSTAQRPPGALHIASLSQNSRQVLAVFEAVTQMLTEVGIRTTPRIWDPGPAWNKFSQTEGKGTHGIYGTWGNYSVFDADAVLHPLYHTEPGGWIGKWYERVEGLDKLIDEARSSVDQPKRKRLYAQIQQMIREEAPTIFLWTQYDTLGISKKVQYAARPDEWLWLYDAKPAAR